MDRPLKMLPQGIIATTAGGTQVVSCGRQQDYPGWELTPAQAAASAGADHPFDRAARRRHPLDARALTFASISASVMGSARLPRACSTSVANTLPPVVRTSTRAAPTATAGSACAWTRSRNATIAGLDTALSEYSSRPAAPNRNATATL